MINFETDMISKYFSWHEMLFLPSWNRIATVEDGLTEEIQNNLIFLAQKMDVVREWAGGPFIVHCTYRPPEYNKLVGGAKGSMHMIGRAMDFHCETIGVEAFQKKVMAEDMLEKAWNMRMERGTQGWTHMDTKQVSQFEARWFNP